jgi:hypothetical protein
MFLGLIENAVSSIVSQLNMTMSVDKHKLFPSKSRAFQAQDIDVGKQHLGFFAAYSTV